ncbi:MAG TPA: phosphate signaling complex protein PhoU [Ignavibacteriaceae bacterium]|nr:phosphate signaling complex protein PhoU [Ignavibacteriaceae bacterium]
MERHFLQQLEKLKTRLIKMCSLVDEQLELALKAVNEENPELALLVIERDNKVDKYDLKVDRICQRIVALNQPVAMDLRMIMSSLTINNNLERVGDIAANIAENFLLIKKKPSFFERIKFASMAQITTGMLKNAIDAFINGDPKTAEKVIQSEELLDKLNVENHKISIEIMKENKDNIEAAVAFLVICRQLERIGDHATNIAEDVFFIVQAQNIRHNYEKFFFSEHQMDDDEEL